MLYAKQIFTCKAHSALLEILLHINKCTNNKSLSPPPYDAQAQALAGLLVELHGE